MKEEGRRKKEEGRRRKKGFKYPPINYTNSFLGIPFSFFIFFNYLFSG
jgi:hypothetical protein